MRRLAARQMVIAAALAAGAHAAAAVLALHGSRPGGEGYGTKAAEGLTVSLGLAEGGLDAPLEDVKAAATVTPLAIAPPPAEGASAQGALTDAGARPIDTVRLRSEPPQSRAATLADVAPEVSAPTAPAASVAVVVAIAPSQAETVAPPAQPAAADADAPTPRAARLERTVRPLSPQAPSATEGREQPRADGDAGAPTKDAAPVAGADAAAREAYVATLQRWLARHKRYPALARARRIEGAGVLAFVVGPAGDVLSARVARSAGHDLLDGEIVAMLRRAEPLPPPPNGRTLDLTAPVTFRLN